MTIISERSLVHAFIVGLVLSACTPASSLGTAEDFGRIRNQVQLVAKAEAVPLTSSLNGDIELFLGRTVGSGHGLDTGTWTYEVEAHLKTAREPLAALAPVAESLGYAVEADGDRFSATRQADGIHLAAVIWTEHKKTNQIRIYWSLPNEKITLTPDQSGRAQDLYNLGGTEDLEIP